MYVVLQQFQSHSLLTASLLKPGLHRLVQFLIRGRTYMARGPHPYWHEGFHEVLPSAYVHFQPLSHLTLHVSLACLHPSDARRDNNGIQLLRANASARAREVSKTLLNPLEKKNDGARFHPSFHAVRGHQLRWNVSCPSSLENRQLICCSGSPHQMSAAPHLSAQNPAYRTTPQFHPSIFQSQHLRLTSA